MKLRRKFFLTLALLILLITGDEQLPAFQNGPVCAPEFAPLNSKSGAAYILSSSLTRNSTFYSVAGLSSILTDGSPYPRTITPNGDGINDRVFFFFEATDAPKSGKIYDLNSAFVGSMRPGPVQDASLIWDGKDDRGNVVSRGIYIYRVSLGEHSVTGTVVVAR